jgi:hypothetical protein
LAAADCALALVLWRQQVGPRREQLAELGEGGAGLLDGQADVLRRGVGGVAPGVAKQAAVERHVALEAEGAA